MLKGAEISNWEPELTAAHGTVSPGHPDSRCRREQSDGPGARYQIFFAAEVGGISRMRVFRVVMPATGSCSSGS